MTMRVTGPEGVVVNFPDGTDPATIDRVMREAVTKSRSSRLKPVTDPELLKQLNSNMASQPKLTPVTDPKLLEQLNAPSGQTPMTDIRGPDGVIYRFPAGMSDDEIKG